jgi:hypothetical protein
VNTLGKRAFSTEPAVLKGSQNPKLQQIGQLAVAQSITTTGMILTIAVAYGGREEIADAVHALPYEDMGNGATLCRANSYTDSHAAFFGRFFGFVHPGEISSSR